MFKVTRSDEKKRGGPGTHAWYYKVQFHQQCMIINWSRMSRMQKDHSPFPQWPQSSISQLHGKGK